VSRCMAADQCLEINEEKHLENYRVMRRHEERRRWVTRRQLGTCVRDPESEVDLPLREHTALELDPRRMLLDPVCGWNTVVLVERFLEKLEEI
jgi:hypothetical protein